MEIFDFSDLELRDLVNLWFQADYDKLELKKSVITSFQCRHRYYVTEKCHQSIRYNIFQFWAPPNQNFWLHQCLL